MYKRTKQALISSPPPCYTCMFKAQFGKAEYSDIAFAITTRVDSAGCFGVIEYEGLTTLTMEEIKIIKEGNYSPSGHNASSIVSAQGIAPAVMENHGTVTAIKEPQVLTPKRTELGKAIRKQYEKGEINMSRHDFTTMEPRNDGVANTLTSVQKDNYLCIPEGTTKGYAEAVEGDSVNLALSNSKTRRGRVGKQIANTVDTTAQQGVVVKDYTKMQKRVINALATKNVDNGDTYNPYNDVLDKSGISPTLTTRPEGNKTAILPMQHYRIRKLTPVECFRLMGVDDANIDKLTNASISNSQLYKLAGNSIVVDVLYHIFRKAFCETENESQQLTLF